MQKKTVIEILEATAERLPDEPALKAHDGAGWNTITWGQYLDGVRAVARGLMRLGLEPGNGVAIIGSNRPEWFIGNLGAIAAGGVPAGIYTTSSPEQIAWITSHAEAPIALVETPELLEKFLEARDSMPGLRTIVLMEGESNDPSVIPWEQLLTTGGEVPEAELEARIRGLDPDSLCTLIYTSGTTGKPKAVMLSHTNLVWTSASAAEALSATDEDQFLSYLPLSHIAEQIATYYTPLHAGACTWFASSVEQLGERLREVRPTVFLGVPRVWEKMQAAIQAIGERRPPLAKRIAAWARRIGLQGGYADQNRQPLPWLYPLADALVFRKVRQKIGLDRARFCLTSAAPISVDTLEFFLSLGIPILEVYGMSECTGPATVSRPEKYRTGKAGRPAPGSEIRIAEDGEVLIRGPHVFLGYYKDPEATRATVDEEGWIHSGDIGTLDEEEFLAITDRKKEILITAGGKNVGPQMIESRLKSIPVVAQAVVIGDRRPFLTALLTLDPDKVRAEAARAGSPATDVASAARCEIFRAHLRQQIDRIDRTLARHETIKKFVIVDEDFSVDTGELTPTMKLKRRVIHEKYRSLIESMYGS